MADPLSMLPDDVRGIIAPHVDADTSPVLDTIGIEIAGKRDEAKAARASSGIEATWKEAEEAYIGIDDANRNEFAAGQWYKPSSLTGPVTTGRIPAQTDYKSTVYLRLTSRYVDAGAAKLGEILLPADGKAFSFHEMPVPELTQAKNDESQVVHSGLGVPLTRPATPDDGQPPPAQPGAPAPARVPLRVKDLATEAIEIARKAAEAAEERVYDWMVQGQFRSEIRKTLFDAARIGVGIVKAPVPKSKRSMVVNKMGGKGVKLTIKETIVPVVEWKDPWNIFPDPACGENIHDGDYIFERDYMAGRQVKALKRLPGYIGSQIDKVLEEGPNKINKTDNRGDQGNKTKDRFEVWYFYGALTKDEMAAIDAASGCPQSDDLTDNVYALVTLINDSVVRATINPLDSGAFPYHSMPWQRRAQQWAGVGIAEQMRTPQKVVNAALRALLNNAGKSAGSQLVINQMAIRPADGSWTITPDKIWFSTEDGPPDVRQAMSAIQVPNVTQELMNIITLGERFAEETTSIPLISQGQSGSTTPDTFGAAQLQNNNANQLLRSVGYSFDDYITEPMVRQFYEWLLLDPDVPDDEKAEFQIDAHGSVALVERAIQDQTIAQMGQMAANPIYGINPKKWSDEFLRSKKLDPGRMKYTDEEQAKIDAAPPPEAPAISVAKINADTQLKLGVMKQQVDQQTAQAEGQIAAAAHVLEGGKAQIEQQRVQGELTIAAHQIQLEHDRALLDYANREKISLNMAKAQLAKTAMELQTERDLNAANNAVVLHKHRTAPAVAKTPGQIRTPAQVPGRAPNGQAFSQGAVGGKPGAGGIPPAALAHLVPGHVTTFGNGQKWTVENGQPRKVA
jgi:hypothetical protein